MLCAVNMPSSCRADLHVANSLCDTQNSDSEVWSCSHIAHILTSAARTLLLLRVHIMTLLLYKILDFSKRFDNSGSVLVGSAP